MCEIKNGVLFVCGNFPWISPSPWVLTYITDIQSYLASTNLLAERNVINSLPPGFETLPDNYLPNFGWHLSYFLPIDDIVRKLESISHRELDLNEYKEKDHLKECLRTGKDLFKRQNSVFQQLEFGESAAYLPEGWEEFQNEILQQQELL